MRKLSIPTDKKTEERLSNKGYACLQLYSSSSSSFYKFSQFNWEDQFWVGHEKSKNNVLALSGKISLHYRGSRRHNRLHFRETKKPNMHPLYQKISQSHFIASNFAKSGRSRTSFPSWQSRSSLEIFSLVMDLNIWLCLYYAVLFHIHFAHLLCRKRGSENSDKQRKQQIMLRKKSVY